MELPLVNVPTCELRSRSGRPVTATDNAAIAAVRNVVEADRRVTIDEKRIRLPPGIEIGRSSKEQSSRAFLKMHRRDGDQLFSRIVTGDESWVHHSTPETKRQSMVWKRPEESAPKKAKVTISAGKVMAIVFWDCKGVLLVDYLPPNTTVNTARYCEVLTKLRAAIKRKRPGLLSRKVLLVHDNARPHAARTTQTLLENFKWKIFTHPSYSPELAPSDFHLFPALKLHLGGKHFANDDEVQAEANHWLRRQDTAWYNSGIKKLLQRFQKCLDRNGVKISEGYEVVLAGDLNTRTGTQGYLHNPLMLPTSLNASRNSKDEVISPNAVQFINFLEDNLLVIINGRTKSDGNGEYTYISERGSSVVDYCIVSHSLLEHRINLLINPLPYSDHMPMVIKMDSNLDGMKLGSSTPCTFKKYKWTSEKETTFIQNLVAIQGSWNSPIEMLNNNFTDRVRSAMHTAGMQVVITPEGPKSKPWFDRECYLSKKALKSQLKIYIKSNSEGDRKAYALLKNKYSSLLTGKKKTYYIKKQERLKEFYTELLATSPPVKYDLSIRVILMPDDELMAVISLSEITGEITHLKRNKACGLDNIPNEAIKALPPAYLTAIKDIYNRVLKTGQIPTTWCKTIIDPIFKNGDADNPHNYRGIALLSNLAKLFSSILKIRLSNWTENRAIILENQAGFRKEHSHARIIFLL
ncbi:hypothetical protein LAZ67_5001511 [Cordylochernes scorpioides]|uniref:Transposase n=1 Tax=Cordylochernes scorpioides TaxID=51811 RepID=A0ABY6KFN6_9ARAC|nr:hypothetical protein LAZ67_5001511 [Cordylochernes scorpioides]